MGALPDANPLVAIAAGGLHLHPAVLAFVTLAVAVFLSRRIIPSLDFLVAPRPAAGEREPRLLLHPAGTVEAAAATAGSAPSRSLLAHFVVLCVAMATAMHAEPLVHAAAELRLIGPGAVICGGLAAAALFNWVIVSVSHHFVAPRPAERGPKTLPPPLHLRPADPAAASTTRPSSSSLARPAFAVLAALTSASWFVEPFASAAAELRLHRVAVVIAVLLFAALFNLSVRSFGSFFRTRRPPVAAARWEWQEPEAIAVAVMSAGVAACLVAAAAGGSAYVYAPARSRAYFGFLSLSVLLALSL